MGTVDTFTNGVLTIKLSNGSPVSGAVTADTEIACEAVQPTAAVHADGDGGGNQGGENQGGNGGDQQGGGNQQGGGDEENEGNQNCTSANLTSGAMVSGPELRLSSAGATWDKVDLIG